MFVIGLCCILSVVAFYQFSVPYFKAKKKLSEVDITSFSCIDLSNNVLVYYILGMLLSIGFLVFSVLNSSTFENWEGGVGISVLLMVSLVAKILASRVFHRFYYSKDTMIYIDKVYRLKSVKSVLPIKRSLNKVKLSFFDGSSITFPPKLGKQLLDILEMNKKK